MDNPAISRHSFSKTKHISNIPDLLSLQIYSWDDFLQEDIWNHQIPRPFRSTNFTSIIVSFKKNSNSKIKIKKQSIHY